MHKQITAWCGGLAAVVALLAGSLAADDRKTPVREEADLSLHIEQVRKPGVAGLKFKIRIVNEGSKPVTLVRPGDGSESGWRTPIVGWSAIPAGDKTKRHPRKFRPPKIPRCGLMNPLKSKELVQVASGKTLEMTAGWIGGPRISRPGKYRVVLYYINRPDLKWKMVQNPGLMKRVRASTPCALQSNEIEVVIPKATK